MSTQNTTPNVEAKYLDLQNLVSAHCANYPFRNFEDSREVLATIHSFLVDETNPIEYRVQALSLIDEIMGSSGPCNVDALNEYIAELS